MEAKELRIGNYVKLNAVYQKYKDSVEPLFHESQVLPISSIQEDNTIRLKKNTSHGDSIGCFPISYINPIPLTEDWLIKFGANKYSEYFELGHTEWYKEEDYFKPKSYYFADGFKDGFKLKYVHQLQNLYFALTGEELNYSVNP